MFFSIHPLFNILSFSLWDSLFATFSLYQFIFLYALSCFSGDCFPFGNSNYFTCFRHKILMYSTQGVVLCFKCVYKKIEEIEMQNKNKRNVVCWIRILLHLQNKSLSTNVFYSFWLPTIANICFIIKTIICLSRKISLGKLLRRKSCSF